jgi:hypothetical protein
MVLEALAALLLTRAAAQGGAPPQLPPSPDCPAAWEDSYRKLLGATKEKWDAKCAEGLTPEQILAVFLPAQPPVSVSVSAPAPSLDAAVKDVKTLDLSIHAAFAGGGVAEIYGEKTAVSGAVAPAVGQGVGAAPNKKMYVLDDGAHIPLSDLKTLVPDPDKSANCGGEFSSGPGWYQQIAHGVACWPGVPYRRAALGYLRLTGLQNYGSDHVGAANMGLNKFYGDLAEKDPQFAAQVQQFYQRVDKLDKDHSSEDWREATLNRAAGTGNDAGVEPGWAWKEALDVAKGDPNLAMRLVGFCGHDNVMRSTIKKPRTEEQAQAAMEAERKRLTGEIESLKKQIAAKGGNPAPASNSAESGPLSIIMLGGDSIEAMQSELRSYQLALSDMRIESFRAEVIDPCPKDIASRFYLPRSLDRDADIPDALKKKIADKQKDGREDKLSAKYYHVLGAAASACEMIRDGAPAWGAQLVEGRAASMYRALRLKNASETFALRRTQMREEYETYRRSLGPGQTAMDEYAFRESLNEKSRANPATRAASLSHMDAYELMERWGYFGQPFPYIGMPAVPLDHSTHWIEGYITKPKPEGWSDARFEAARKRMETFFVDTEWTVAEHAAGARFAAKVCREEPEKGSDAAATPGPRSP